MLILCSNPREYNHTVRSFDMAIMDRVRFMKLGFSAREFLSYGEKQGFHPAILEFLGLYPVNIHICQKNDSGNDSVVMPRGWENLSWVMDILAGHNTEQVKTFYRGKTYQEKYKLVQMLCQKLKEQGEHRQVDYDTYKNIFKSGFLEKFFIEKKEDTTEHIADAP